MTKSRNLIRARHQWTGFELDALRRLFPNVTTKSLEVSLGIPYSTIVTKAKAMGLKKSAEFLASPLSGRLDGVRGSETRFVPGDPRRGTPFQKGVHVSPETQFKAGARPANWQPVGALRINSAGDLDIKVAEGKNQWVAMRRFVWETEVGPIPPGMLVEVLNGDPHDTQIGNLYLATRREHIANHLHRKYPKELRSAMQLQGRLMNRIKALEGAEHE
jgi:hypothetical protein